MIYEIIERFVTELNIKEMSLGLNNLEWHKIHREYKKIMNDTSITRLQHIRIGEAVIMLYRTEEETLEI